MMTVSPPLPAGVKAYLAAFDRLLLARSIEQRAAARAEMRYRLFWIREDTRRG